MNKSNFIEPKNDSAKPYFSPIAHNVRPAAQSIGIRGCEDCHSTDAYFFFGDVAIDSAVISESSCVKKMFEFQELSPFYTKVFAMSFAFRPWLKVIALTSCSVLAGVLLLYVLKAIHCVAKIMVGQD